MKTFFSPSLLSRALYNFSKVGKRAGTLETNKMFFNSKCLFWWMWWRIKFLPRRKNCLCAASQKHFWGSWHSKNRIIILSIKSNQKKKCLKRNSRMKFKWVHDKAFVFEDVTLNCWARSNFKQIKTVIINKYII